ncbi:hypothetical protein ACFQZQ_08270 [Lysobacter koreensis]|uniref:DUF3106 domain-containing protein n=1 Tax=Lysobacter koreensis TaxID=266122 RepID=A0ABW2YN35_9GAMM
MPDPQIPREMVPRDWAEALRALPAALPPADGWTRVVQALDAAPAQPAIHSPRRESRRRWPLWLAAAAVLAGVAALPFALIDEAPSLSTPARVAVVTPTADTLAARGSTAPDDKSSAPQQPVPAAVSAAAQPDRPTGRAVASTAPLVGARQPDTTPSIDAADTHVAGTPASDARAASTSQDVAPSAVAAANTDTATGPDTTADAAPDALLQLQAESAQLEALIAFARDERVASASSAVLASDLDARIARIDAELIDAALSQADVPADRRTALWQARIDALRELAGVETTQRWLAARGQPYDGALVRVD